MLQLLLLRLLMMRFALTLSMPVQMMMILVVMVEQHFGAFSAECFIYPRTTKTETTL